MSLVAEAVQETTEDSAFADQGGSRWRRDSTLAGDRLVVVGAKDGVDDAGLIKALGPFDPGHVANEHAVAHDLGFKAGCAVGIPFGFTTAWQRYTDAELADIPAEQVSVDTMVTKRVDYPPSPKFVHVRGT